MTDFALKERVLRLEIENQQLKSGGGVRDPKFEQDYDMALRLNAKYAEEIKQLKQKLESAPERRYTTFK